MSQGLVVLDERPGSSCEGVGGVAFSFFFFSGGCGKWMQTVWDGSVLLVGVE